MKRPAAALPPTRVLKEIRLDGEPEAAIGDQVKVDVFADGDKIEVVGKSKGRGFAGTIKRHNFQRGPESHGSMNVRAPGSIGQSAYPSRVIKGTRSSGHMGDARVTVKGLTVAKVDVENNLLMVRGAVPGANGSLVVVKKVVVQGLGQSSRLKALDTEPETRNSNGVRNYAYRKGSQFEE